MKLQRLFFLALASVATSAFAQTTFDYTSDTINSNEVLDDAGNEHRVQGAGASYLFGNSISIISGTLNAAIAGTFASEARVQITNNNTGKTGLIQFTSTGSFTNPFNLTAGNAFSLTGNIVGSAVNAADTFDLEFYESFNDGAGTDAIWTNLKFASTVFVPPTPPTNTHLGLINDVSSDYLTADLTANHLGGAIKWYKFSHAGASNGAGTFLDIDTEGTTGLTDTEIGLYDSLGNLVGLSDDDDGSGNLSQLSYGLTAPTRTIGTSVGGNGRDGSLGAGVYYLAVGGFNTTFSSGFNVTTTSTNTTGDVRVNFRTNAVPEPGTMAALGLGALALIRRRRNSK